MTDFEPVYELATLWLCGHGYSYCAACQKWHEDDGGKALYEMGQPHAIEVRQLKDEIDDLKYSRDVWEKLAHRTTELSVEMATSAAAENARLRSLATELRRTVTVRGYPGRECMRSGWLDMDWLARWDAALAQKEATNA